MPRTCTIVGVDEKLQWVVRVPEVPAGASRAATPEQLAGMGARFDALAAALAEPAAPFAAADIIGIMARLVLGACCEPPELPYIGEPFGGEDGSD